MLNMYVNIYTFIQHFLPNRQYDLQVNKEFSQIYNIQAGALQGSVASPILYTIFTSNMPVTNNVLLAIYADNTAILATSTNSSNASIHLQWGFHKNLREYEVSVATVIDSRTTKSP